MLTPTPLPPMVGTPMININAADWGIWQYTGYALQSWNRLESGTDVIQIAVLIVIVIGFVSLLIIWLPKINNNQDE